MEVKRVQRVQLAQQENVSHAERNSPHSHPENIVADLARLNRTQSDQRAFKKGPDAEDALDAHAEYRSQRQSQGEDTGDGPADAGGCDGQIDAASGGRARPLCRYLKMVRRPLYSSRARCPSVFLRDWPLCSMGWSSWLICPRQMEPQPRRRQVPCW